MMMMKMKRKKYDAKSRRRWNVVRDQPTSWRYKIAVVGYGHTQDSALVDEDDADDDDECIETKKTIKTIKTLTTGREKMPGKNGTFAESTYPSSKPTTLTRKKDE